MKNKNKPIKKHQLSKTKIDKQLKKQNKQKLKETRQNLNMEKLSKKENALKSKAKQVKINNAKILLESKNIMKLNRRPKGMKKIKNLDSKAIIELRGVQKSYATKMRIFKAIDNVNLKINKGEFVAILGPSGSGKTTLLNIISGLDRPTYGDAIVNGVNLSALSDGELTTFRRKYVGFIFQSYNLLPSLNVLDNIEVGRTLQAIKKLRLNTNDLLKTLGIAEQANKRVYQLSGGQQQRVSIARALTKNPTLLICDEPTGALDQKSSKSVIEIFKKINKTYKTTIVLVTHNEAVSKVADRVIHVIDGTINKISDNTKGTN